LNPKQRFSHSDLAKASGQKQKTRACMQRVDGLRCLLNSGDYLIDAKGSTCAFSVETVKYQMRQR
jgi:hypothetical protein